MLIERFLPSYDFNEVHTLDVRAAPARVFQAIKDVTPAEIRGLQQKSSWLYPCRTPIRMVQ